MGIYQNVVNMHLQLSQRVEEFAIVGEGEKSLFLPFFNSYG